MYSVQWTESGILKSFVVGDDEGEAYRARRVFAEGRDPKVDAGSVTVVKTEAAVAIET